MIEVISIKDAVGPYTISEGPKQVFTGKLFAEDEQERAFCIAKGLEGLTIQEATDLIDRFKIYLLQSVFCPDVSMIRELLVSNAEFQVDSKVLHQVVLKAIGGKEKESQKSQQ